MNKKQKKMLVEALYLIDNYKCANSRKWDRLFEEGYNNSNCLLMEIIKLCLYAQGLRHRILDQRSYMPEVLVNIVEKLK